MACGTAGTMPSAAATFFVGRITVAPPRAVAFCLLTIHAGAFTPARVSIAALSSRAVGNDLSVESGLAGKVGCRGTPQITAICRTSSDRNAQQDDETEARDRS